MAEEKTKANSYDMEAEKILRNRHSSDNQSEIINWLNRSSNIIKSYRDGFISDEDIERRERFVNYSYTRESMLVSCLGLLEKSNTPNAKAQIEVLKGHLAMIRNCRITLLKNTPPKNIAKRIQERQVEEKKKVEEAAENRKKEQEKTLPEEILSGSSIFGRKRPSPGNAVLASLMLMSLSRDLSPKDLKALLANEAVMLNTKNPLYRDALLIIQELRDCGANDKEIEQIASQDMSNPDIFTRLEQRFYSRDSDKLNDRQGTQSFADNFYLHLREAVSRYDLAHNVYDSSIMGQFTDNLIAGKDGVPNSQNIDRNEQKKQIIETLRQKINAVRIV